MTIMASNTVKSLQSVRPFFRFAPTRQPKFAISKSYAMLEVEFPNCAEMLFDEAFLLNSAYTALVKHLSGNAMLTGRKLAAMWAQQLGGSAENQQKRAEKIVVIANKYLDILTAQTV